ncbi:MAG TPA: hypothetical protein VMC03_14795 [Streptosporangiaceae bacterium]|nr:hypothetical protein [Streptosporangiaceae bacterium]
MSRQRQAGAAGLLAAACVAWSAIPVPGPGVAGGLLLATAAACAVLGTARLALGPESDESATFLDPVARAGRAAADLIRAVPWAEGLVVAAAVLEALHRSRPWHTGLLGAALIAYLFAVHLAESRAAAAVLRPQAPLIAAGLGLLALAVGAAYLPAATGSTADLMAVLAALAAVVVGGLALPASATG